MNIVVYAAVSRIVPIQSILGLIRIHTSGREYAFHSRQNKLPNKTPPHYDAKQDRNAEAAVLSEQHKGEIMKMQ